MNKTHPHSSPSDGQTQNYLGGFQGRPSLIQGLRGDFPEETSISKFPIGGPAQGSGAQLNFSL